jgi:uncharacterized protein (DUF305 family)
MKPTRILLTGCTAIALLTGCGASKVLEVADKAKQIAESVVEFNDADVMFAQMMIPHHEQAVELSNIALDPTVGASEAVKSLATRIKGAQDPEIIVMKGFLTTWKKSLTMDNSMDHGDAMNGMLTAKEITELSAMRGAEFDRAFITGMTAHHEGAIAMAADVVKDGKNLAVKALAQKITSAQEAEIAEMKKLLG